MKRYSNEQKELIKSNLEKVLTYYGAKFEGHNWTCLQSRHKKAVNNLSVKKKLCCCHCGLQGDALNVIAILENFDIKKEFSKIIKKGLDIIGENNISFEYESKTYIKASRKVNLNYNLTSIITKAFEKARNTDYAYFFERGIKLLKLIEKYKIIGGNPLYILPREIVPKLNNIEAYGNIIPVWENGIVVNCILRRDDNLSQLNTKILNLKGIPLKIWNADLISNAKENDIIFVNEGIFDALTYEQLGYNAIALNSINMVGTFINLINEHSEKLKSLNVKFILSSDSDKYGEEAMKKIDKFLNELNITSLLINFDEYKDANEFYCNDWEQFIENTELIIDRINNPNFEKLLKMKF